MLISVEGTGICLGLHAWYPHWIQMKYYKHSTLIFAMQCYMFCRSQWPRGLRRRSSAARLLRLWVRIAPGTWIFVCCDYCVLSGRGLCDELITRPEESYRLWRVVMCVLETSNTSRLKSATGLWKIQPQGCNARKTNKRVSRNLVLIIRRSNCINTTSGIFYFVSVTV